MRLPAAERREQLLHTAVAVFAEHGFHATSMNDVAEAAGVTKPVLYQHFSSKRELFIELLADIGAELRETIAKATADASGPRQQIENGFRAYFGWAVAQGAAFRVLFSDRTRADAELAQAVARVESVVADRVASLPRSPRRSPS